MAIDPSLVGRLEDALQQLGIRPMDCNPQKPQLNDNGNGSSEVNILVRVTTKLPHTHFLQLNDSMVFFFVTFRFLWKR